MSQSISVSPAQSTDDLLIIMSPTINDINIFDNGNPEHDQASKFSSCVNLVKTMLGSGILAMPSTLETIGLIPGLLSLVLAMILSGSGLYLLVLAANKCTPQRQASINKVCFAISPIVGVLFDLTVIIKSLGVSTSYFVIVGDALQGIISGLEIERGILLDRSFLITLASILIIPLILMRKIDSLRFTSVAGILVIVYLCILSFWYFLSIKHGQFHFFKKFSFPEFLSSFSVLVFSFTCHQNIFFVYNEAKKNDLDSMKIIITNSVGFTAILYAIFSTLSLLTFGNTLKGNIFDNYPENSYLAVIARLLFALLAIFTIPLQIYPLGKSTVDIFAHVLDKNPRELQETLHYKTSLLALFFIYILSIYMVDLKNLLSLIGKVAGTPICYIFPALIYYFSIEEKNLSRTISSIILFFSGVLILISTLISI